MATQDEGLLDPSLVHRPWFNQFRRRDELFVRPYDPVLILPRELDNLGAANWSALLDAREDRLRNIASELFGGGIQWLSDRISPQGFPSFGNQTLNGVTSTIEVLAGVGALSVDTSMFRRIEGALAPGRFFEISNLEGWADTPLLDMNEAKDTFGGIGLTRTSTDGKGILVGVVDSGLHLPLSDGATIRRFSECPDTPDEEKAVLEEEECQDFHTGVRVVGGGYHGTRISRRIAGYKHGVAPAAELAVTAVLTDVRRGLPVGSRIQIGRGLNWLVTSTFGRDDGRKGCDIVNISVRFHSEIDADFQGIAQALAMAASTERLIVCAVGAGSGYQRTVGPVAARDSVLAVGAAELFDNKWRWCGGNDFDIALRKPEICAPGNSTSMAAPVVTGLAARLLMNNKQLSAAQLKKRICAKPAPLVGLPDNFSCGLVQAR